MKRQISMREYAFGIFLMSLGVMLNVLYWVTELFIRKKTPYEDFMEDPAAHAVLHSGKVWVEDNSPRGAVFVVLLPKRRES